MATQDTLLFASQAVFEEEAVTHIDEVVVSKGGKGLVAAIAMRKSGADVLPFALVGPRSSLPSQFGDVLDVTHLHEMLDRDSRTWISISGGDKMITFVALGSMSTLDGLAARVDQFVAGVDLLYVTAEHPALLRAVYERAASHDVQIALNPSLPMLDLLADTDPELLPALISRSSTILCNDWEAPKLLAAVGADRWSELGLPASAEAVVTSGAAGGSYAETPFELWSRFEATPAEVRCVVGAGDTFNGAYLTARFNDGCSMEESCRRAADLAALKVAYRGSALPIAGMAFGS
jgi:sugar/nucleoside kinase (ribokinase family)